MGYTLKPLAVRELSSESVFSSRFVVEVAEQFHMHYRNLRIILGVTDFKQIAKGFIQALNRWDKRGRPEPKEGTHIELCRKAVSGKHNDGVKINLNKNLYNLNKGKIFADGADFEEPTYIHLKVRDVRLELSIDDFKVFAEAVEEARGKLNEDQ